jgi:hypothetical protein
VGGAPDGLGDAIEDAEPVLGRGRFAAEHGVGVNADRSQGLSPRPEGG